ncbi:MAG: Flp pilus assembly complex ATPase component TadA, partial [Mariprofundus sp.]|nr:Flp pilus assembly complex ATPase component TadA [Mariprofundus sp.]
GEIRDLETAEIAIQASLTGHLVFATLHTNDALSAILRLQDMGLEPYLIASSLIMVQAQRLVRRLCPHCRHSRPATDDDWKMLEVKQHDYADIEHIYDANGCDQCMNTGYIGRVAIYEITRVSDAMRNAIHEGKGLPSMRRIAKQEHMITLRQDVARHVAAGITSIEEVLRVTMEDVVATNT